MLTSLKRITLGFKKYKRHYVLNGLCTDFNFAAQSIEYLRKINMPVEILTDFNFFSANKYM
jgi:hypothetical protein